MALNNERMGPDWPTQANRGLIIFPGALGDLICLLPALRELDRRYPEIEFELMARAELARFAVRRLPIVAGHSIDRQEIAALFSGASSQASLLRRFFGQFRRIDCFFAYDNTHFRSSLRQAARGQVFFYPFRPSGEGHVAEGYLRAIGANLSPLLAASIEVLAEDLSEAWQTINVRGLEPKRFALIVPGSGSTRKNWPVENFALLAERIQLSQRVLVVLGPAENSFAPVFHARSLSVVSEIELGQLAGLARLASCFIGNDSGVSHLASAAGARGLVIFGPTNPERWRPLGKVRIIRKEPLEDLPPDEIWPTVQQMIRSH
jgi:ADP-heptose:LPS heptosyltransferase